LFGTENQSSLENCYTGNMKSLESWTQNEGVQALFLIIGGIVVYYIVKVVLNSLIKHAIRGKLRKSSQIDIEKRRATVSSLVILIWRIVVMVTVGASVFKIFFPAIDFTPLFASAGIVGIAVAFGSQALVKDFLTGVFIITENQYRVGDYVTINDADGRVEHIGARSTVIRDDNGNVHYLPNGSIIHVINKTMGYSKVHFTLLLDAATDLDNAISVINQVGDRLAEHEKWAPKILSAPQFSSIGALTGSSIEVTIAGKTQPSEQWSVTAEMRKRLLKAFDKHDIKLA
jgi:small-conductance mechanosensitive channel